MFEFGSAFVTIHAWEFMLLVVYIVVFVLYYGRKKRLMIGQNPEYKYYLLGYFARLFGSLSLIWIFVYYYDNGDTISFYNSAVPVANLAMIDPGKFFEMFFLPNTLENYRYLYDSGTGFPLGYIYADERTYFLVKLVGVLLLVSFKSIILVSVVVSTITYGGVWNLYRMLVRYYPQIPGRLAIAVLFLPSCVFWGSGLLKDTFAFSAVCWFIYGLDSIFFVGRNAWRNWVNVVLAAWIMIAMKPYVFMTVFPATLLWLLYHRVRHFRNALVRMLFLPVAMTVLATGSIFVIQGLGDRLGKFSLDVALQTIVVSQADLKRSEQYGTNFFDIGEMEATWSSVLGKFPQATFGGLFRPQLPECNNIVMVLAGLENTFLFLLVLYILFRSRVVFFITLVLRNPLLQLCFVFAVGYAFMIGVTTPNFGALVRFKIPMLPLFVSGLFITSHILDRRRKALATGQRFDLDAFSGGDPDRSDTRVQERSVRPARNKRR